MATLPLIRYPLDPSGTSADNKIVGEIHVLEHRTIRVCAPTYGAFYSESMQITDQVSGLVLTKGVQYYPAELYEVPTGKFGKEVCAILVITDTSVSDQISLSYQAVGGEFSVAADAVINQILALQNDNRPVQWGQIIAKPSEYPPSHHLHDLGDIYGFEYLVHAIDRLRAAILTGDDYSHDAIYQYVDSMLSGQAAKDAAQDSSLGTHLNNFSNPHRVSAAQLGVYLRAEVDALVNAVANSTATHQANRANPHGVTAAQLGVYLTSQTYSQAEISSQISAIASALQNDYNSQISNLQAQVTTHVQRSDNPHFVNHLQVGTYNTVEIDAKIAGGGGSFGNWTQFQINNGWSQVMAAKGLIHIWSSDEPFATCALYKNGLLVSYNTKGGSRGYGRQHHDTTVFAAGDTLSWTTTGSNPGNANVYNM